MWYFHLNPKLVPDCFLHCLALFLPLLHRAGIHAKKTGNQNQSRRDLFKITLLFVFGCYVNLYFRSLASWSKKIPKSL